MSRETIYEWCVETYDADPDKNPDAEIINTAFSDLLIEVGVGADHLQRCVLIRDVHANGYVHRSWAYVDPTSKMLPREFTEPNSTGEYVSIGVKVPQRFHREIAKYMAG